MDESARNLTESEFGSCLRYLKTLFPLDDTPVLHYTQLAVFILLGVVSIYGIFANTIVVHILNFKLKTTPLTTLLNGLAVSDLLVCLHQTFATALPFLLLYFSPKSSSLFLRAVLNFKMISIPTHLIGKIVFKF